MLFTIKKNTTTQKCIAIFLNKCLTIKIVFIVQDACDPRNSIVQPMSPAEVGSPQVQMAHHPKLEMVSLSEQSRVWLHSLIPKGLQTQDPRQKCPNQQTPSFSKGHLQSIDTMALVPTPAPP